MVAAEAVDAAEAEAGRTRVVAAEDETSWTAVIVAENKIVQTEVAALEVEALRPEVVEKEAGRTAVAEAEDEVVRTDMVAEAEADRPNVVTPEKEPDSTAVVPHHEDKAGRSDVVATEAECGWPA